MDYPGGATATLSPAGLGRLSPLGGYSDWGYHSREGNGGGRGHAGGGWEVSPEATGNGGCEEVGTCPGSCGRDGVGAYPSPSVAEYGDLGTGVSMLPAASAYEVCTGPPAAEEVAVCEAPAKPTTPVDPYVGTVAAATSLALWGNGVGNSGGT